MSHPSVAIVLVYLFILIGGFEFDMFKSQKKKKSVFFFIRIAKMDE